MTQPHEALIALADHFGIARHFWDWKGRHVEIPAETITAVLKALDVDASTPERCVEELERLHNERWLRTLPATVVIEEHDGGQIDVHVPAGSSLTVEVHLEQGAIRGMQQIDNWEPDREVAGQWRGEASFRIDGDLPTGYHRVVAHTSEGTKSCALIVTPKFVGFPTSMQNSRVWGHGTQLYSVTSKRSWGVGDLQDLADLMTWGATQQFADYVLINPLHAAQVVTPMEPSPYLPASRRFINPIYIRPETIEEYRRLDRETKREIKAMRKESRATGEVTGAVERNAVWAFKLEALRRIHKVPLRPARKLAFDDFRRREGQGLHLFALWSALSIEFGQDWRLWPETYQNPISPEVAAFAVEHADEVEFFEWLQWIAQLQVSSAQTTAHDAGMKLGIVSDLAVGVHTSSAETWMMPDVFAQGMNVGAPPDNYNQAGQDWGQPPWRPDRLEELEYRPFRDMVRAALRRVGGVRIDHIIGLFRLWWVPQGLGPQMGTYVRYNHEALVGILALEAQRSQALVVGEDLGTVEPWVREYLSRRGILGTSVLWFEFGEDGQPLQSEHWREYCMASVTTHDLPPTIGYLAGDHVRIRQSLGLLEDSLEVELQRSHDEQSAWLHRLIEDGLLDEEEADDPVEIMLGLHRFITKTPSKVLLSNLVDVVGERRMQNQPGTIDEYPNWRVPLADRSGQVIPLEKIFNADLPKRVAAVMNGLEDQPGSRWG